MPEVPPMSPAPPAKSGPGFGTVIAVILVIAFGALAVKKLYIDKRSAADSGLSTNSPSTITNR